MAGIKEVTQYYTGYSDVAWEDIEGVLRRAKAALDGWDFDTFVATGTSGLMVVPVLAREMRKNLFIIRKDADNAHNSSPYIGSLGDRWVFVDDFVDSAKTFKRVQLKMAELVEWDEEAFDYVPRQSTMVGILQYAVAEWSDNLGAIKTADMPDWWLYR